MSNTNSIDKDNGFDIGSFVLGLILFLLFTGGCDFFKDIGRIAESLEKIESHLQDELPF